MNHRIRRFQDNLVDLINEYSDVPIEARLVVLELMTGKVQGMADNTILAELAEQKEDDECKKPIPE